MPYSVLVIIFSILLLPGIVGVVMPALPSIPYMFVIALIFGFIDKFTHLTVVNIIVLALITLVSLLVDYFSGILGAKYGGAAKQSMVFGMVGFLIGIIMFPPFGGFAGLFLGVLIAELIYFNDHIKAIKAATGGLLGTLFGMIINLLLSISFLGLFILFSFR
jgi:uncharacterized protein YqgC (DUF456 family)